MERVILSKGIRPSFQSCWISLKGPDARDFLQRLTTVDVRSFPEGSGSPGFFLSPQGKIRSYFNLWHCDPDRYAFELDAGIQGQWKTEFLSFMDQYTFGEKIQLEHSDELECRWFFAETQQGVQSQTLHYRALNLKDGSVASVCFHGDRDFGRPWYSVWASPQHWESADFVSELFSLLELGERWIEPESTELWRIQALRPRMDYEITAQTSPLEVGLWDGIAVNKGCYPGQEVIEKISALGSPARRLIQVVGPLQDNPQTALCSLSVSSFVQCGCDFYALAVVSKKEAKVGTPVVFENGGVRFEGVISKVAPYRSEITEL